MDLMIAGKISKWPQKQIFNFHKEKTKTNSIKNPTIKTAKIRFYTKK